ncbi:MAG: MATE family efflux transporter [Bacteroidales bacterium]|jgi:putative MATE family efflux protein|nr:MATE family efflux transporter [Bacteroidales bacterium]
MADPRQVHDLEHEKIGKLMWKYFLPSFASMMANALYNIVDRIYIGQGVDALALSGLSVIFPLMIIVMAFGMLVGIGSSVRVSISLGEKDYPRANRILGNALFLSLVMGLTLMVVGFLIRDKILLIFGAGPETLTYASDYFNIILAGIPFGLTGYALNNVIRAEGNPRIAMISIFISAGLNIILDPIFIFGLDMGVKGAALATIISQAVLCVWVLRHFRSKKSVTRLSLPDIAPDPYIIRYIISIGFAPFAMNVASSIVTGVMNTLFIRYGGDISVGAMGIVHSSTMMLVMTIISINMAIQPIVGFNYGAGLYCRVKESVMKAIKYATLIATGGWLICMLIPGAVISIFNSDSLELREAGVLGLRIYCAVLPVVGYQIIASTYFQAIGQARLAAFLSLLRQIIVLLPLIIILPRFWGVTGVWIANPISDLVAAVVSYFFFRRELRKLNCPVDTPVDVMPPELPPEPPLARENY